MKKAAKTIRVVYQLKVTVRNVHPPVWRRVQVWEDATLVELHRVLQIVVGWEDCHLHQFKIGESDYGIPSPDDEFLGRPVIDETRVSLQNVVPRVGTQFEYWYDFGDDWLHDLLLEAILLPESRTQYPRCIAGERSGPPEDVGGPWGYQEYLEALADPDHEDHEEKLDLRGPFDPESFSITDVNKHLQKEFRSARKTAAKSVSAPARRN
jgi:pRiA4b ORF-3-like protein